MSPRAAWRLESLGFDPVYDYGAGKVDWFAGGLDRAGDRAFEPRLADLIEPEVATCRMDQRVGEVADAPVCLVVNDAGVVLGRLGRKARAQHPDRLVGEVMKEGPSTYRPNVDAGEMAGKVAKHDLKWIVVTTSEGILVGVVDASRMTVDAGTGARR